MAASFCLERKKFGSQKEIELLEQIQQNLGEPVIQEKNQFSIKDYSSTTYNIELKSRRYYDCKKYPNWLVPACKFRDSSKPLVIYYFWDGDKTLWRYDYKEQDKKEFIFKKGPISDQDHYDIPKRFFTEVSEGGLTE